MLNTFVDIGNQCCGMPDGDGKHSNSGAISDLARVPCPYRQTISLSTAFLRTSSDDSTLVLKPRCVLCHWICSEKIIERQRLYRELALSQGKCLYAMSCEEEVPEGETICLTHRERQRNAGWLTYSLFNFY